VSTHKEFTLWATPEGAITGWLKVDAQLEPTTHWAGTGPLTSGGSTITNPGSRPGHGHANNLWGSNGT
jgi:hypothetical protein